MTKSPLNQSITYHAYPSVKRNPDALAELFNNREALPFWVADMDIPAPAAVIEQLTKRAEHGTYGYEYRTADYTEALLAWYRERHNWEIAPEHLEQCPSIMNAVAVLIDQHTEAGDGVIVQPPVFFEFRGVIRSNGRKMVKNPLTVQNGRYTIDFEDLKTKAAEPRNKVLILCNPHNPVGRVWMREELTQIGEICQQYGVFVISDEIHGDIIYPPNTFTPFVSLPPELAATGVSCISAGKTFNLPGMVDAMVVIPDDDRRAAFHDFQHRYQTNKTNVLTSVAVETAYREGAVWLDDVLDYLTANIEFIQSYLAQYIPTVKLVEPDGTYLIWLDFRELGMDAKALHRFLAEEAGIAVNAGHWFGREGAGYARMNIACPRQTLEAALGQLHAALSERRPRSD